MRELKLLNHLMTNVMKITQNSIDDVNNNIYENIDSNFQTRGKMLDIIATIQENLSATPNVKDSHSYLQYNNQLNQLIDKLTSMDDYILEKLNGEKTKTQIQIAKTYKNKENLKGYNLNSLK